MSTLQQKTTSRPFMNVMRASSERFSRLKVIQLRTEGWTCSCSAAGVDLQLLRRRGEIFLAVIWSQITGAIRAIDCILGVRQRALVEIGGENFNGPVFETTVSFFE